MSTIETLWSELESEGDPSGWRMRLARPQPGYPLHVALEGGTRRRALLLRTPIEAIPPRRDWPTCHGLEFFTESVNGHPHCGVALLESRFADVFAAVAEDLARRVGDTATPGEAVRTLLGQLAKWQRFLAAGSDELGDEAQRGLWGELHCLRHRLLPFFETVADGHAAIVGWKGSRRTHQDFQYSGGALEVKTTTSKHPVSVRITSERQLDDTAWPALFLHVLVLDARDNGHDSLPTMVAVLRDTLGRCAPAAREPFEDGLFAAGYLDAHAPRYSERGYSLREEHWFRVWGAFPRLVESTMPAGTGDASYLLSVAACSSFSVLPQDALTTLAGHASQAPRGHDD